jgi:hypothetical protein
MKDESKTSGEGNPGSGVVALQRIGRGILGAWCAIGPFALIFAYSEFESGLLIVFAFFVAVFYAIAIWKWRNQGSAFLKALALDTLLMFVFAGIAGVIGGIISAFGGPASHRMGAVTIVFAGFWILEARRSKKR